MFLGLQGLWQESMDTLSLTLAAVVISLLIGIPLGIWAGLSDRAHRILTPVLDFMQTMPTFVYLAPLTLFFLIGPASATIATLIYAAPSAIRITAHAIRSVPRTTVEASESLGATQKQTLVKVLLPSARKTIVLGINQTIMAALSMVTIAALIDAPGLGKTVVKALQTLDVGTAFNAGLAIVVLAIVLDRVTTAAASERRKLPRWALFGGLGVTGVCVYLSYTYLWAAEFQSDVEIGSAIRKGATAVTEWAQDSLPVITDGFKDFVTFALINPLQALLAESPWFLVALVIVALSFMIGGVRPHDRLRRVRRGADRDGPVAGLDDHAGVHPGRHDPGDAAGNRRRCLDGTQQAGRPVHPADPRRGAGDARLRLPGALPGVVLRVPLHRDHRGRGVRGAGGDQDHRGRHPRGVDRDRRSVHGARVELVADDREGAAAHGARGVDPRRQPGPDLRALDGRRRRSRRQPARSATTWW